MGTLLHTRHRTLHVISTFVRGLVAVLLLVALARALGAVALILVARTSAAGGGPGADHLDVLTQTLLIIVATVIGPLFGGLLVGRRLRERGVFFGFVLGCVLGVGTGALWVFSRVANPSMGPGGWTPIVHQADSVTTALRIAIQIVSSAVGGWLATRRRRSGTETHPKIVNR